MGQISKRTIALMVCLVLNSQLTWALSMNHSDHWSYGSMKKLVESEVFLPVEQEWTLDDNISRGAFVRLVNRALGEVSKASPVFIDVGEDHIYFNDVGHAYVHGYVSGYADGSFKPEGTLSRQEAAVIISKAIKLENTTLDLTKAFADTTQVPEWSRTYISNMILNGYYGGYPDKTIRAESLLTYGEALGLVDKVMGWICNSDIVYPSVHTVEGNVTVIKPNVKLENLKINGSLIIGGQIGDGDVRLSNVDIVGDLLVFGGGVESIHLENTSVSNLIVDRKEAPVRIYAKSGSYIGNTIVETSSILEEEAEAIGFTKIEVIPSSSDFNLALKGAFTSVEVSEPEVRKNEWPEGISAENGSVPPFESQTAEAGNSNMNIVISSQGRIEKFISEGNVDITGDGQIETMQVKGKDVSVKTMDTNISNKEKISSERKKSSKKDHSNQGNHENPVLDSQYILNVASCFVGAPVANITISDENTVLKGYSLLIDSKELAVDTDRDGIICIPYMIYDESRISIQYEGELIDKLSFNN